MPKKTFSITEYKDLINEILAKSTMSKDMREGIIIALETVLHETNNYKGFEYLSSNEVPENELPGINRIYDDYELNFKDTDDTRRKYF